MRYYEGVNNPKTAGYADKTVVSAERAYGVIG